MVTATPFTREAGSGPSVVCLHANASSSNQWRVLMDMLSPQFHVFAADSCGSGKSIDWPSDRTMGLNDEADLSSQSFALRVILSCGPLLWCRNCTQSCAAAATTR